MSTVTLEVAHAHLPELIEQLQPGQEFHYHPPGTTLGPG